MGHPVDPLFPCVLSAFAPRAELFLRSKRQAEESVATGPEKLRDRRRPEGQVRICGVLALAWSASAANRLAWGRATDPSGGSCPARARPTDSDSDWST